MKQGEFRVSDLVRVVDPTPVECLGGPDDGEFRRADRADFDQRIDGMYVVVSDQRDDGEWYIVAHRWVPA